MKLENKTAQIIVTKIYEHDLCDCCCDHPDDVLNFVLAKCSGRGMSRHWHKIQTEFEATLETSGNIGS